MLHGTWGVVQFAQSDITRKPFGHRHLRHIRHPMLRRHAIGIAVAPVLHQTPRKTLAVLCPNFGPPQGIRTAAGLKQQIHRSIQTALAQTPPEPFIDKPGVITQRCRHRIDQPIHAVSIRPQRQPRPRQRGLRLRHQRQHQCPCFLRAGPYHVVQPHLVVPSQRRAMLHDEQGVIFGIHRFIAPMPDQNSPRGIPLPEPRQGLGKPQRPLGGARWTGRKVS